MANDDTPRPGRPTRLNDDMIDAIARLLGQGQFRSVVCQVLGIRTARFRAWMRDGRTRPESIFGTFRARVLQSEAEAETRIVEAIVQKGMESDPKLLLRWLERRYPERWGSQRAELAQLRRRIVEMEKLLDKRG